MKPYRISPALSDRLWGGYKLKNYGKTEKDERIAESWEISLTDGGVAKTDGKPLTEVFEKEKWGTLCRDFERFPVLTKFIDAKENLSVQVHPSDEYALKNENSYGKTEMWIILEAEPGAGLYMGLKKPTDPDTFKKHIEDGTVEELLSFVPVKPYDVFFIPAGTLHAIGGGVLLYEVQQNSDLTYRVYDYHRRDKDGNLRPLHVEKAMKVADLDVYQRTVPNDPDPAIIGKCSYFTTRFYKQLFTNHVFFVDDESYLALTVVDGCGTVNGQNVKKGDSLLFPANAKEVTLNGEMTVITVAQK